MKFPFFSVIGLISLYILIFRSGDVNKQLEENARAFSILKQKLDTIPVKPRYVDIYTGQEIDLWYDAGRHMTINRSTNEPVEFYINTSNWDTVYGKGQFVVNNLIVKDIDGRYKLDDAKVKIDGDELKIKDGDRKLKIDGEEFKMKDGDLKIKHDHKDGEGKIKGDSTKIKIDDDELKVKSGDEKYKTETDKTKLKEGEKKIKNKKGEIKQ